MSDDQSSSFTELQEHGAAAFNEVREALGELWNLLSAEQRVIGKEVLAPVQHFVHGSADLAEVAVIPLAQFVDRQRELADQMATWAQLQHELADSMAAWADLQRQLANAIGLWLAPVGGAAHLTTRVLQGLASETAAPPPAPTEAPTPRGRPARSKSRKTSNPSSSNKRTASSGAAE